MDTRGGGGFWDRRGVFILRADGGGGRFDWDRSSLFRVMVGDGGSLKNLIASLTPVYSARRTSAPFIFLLSLSPFWPAGPYVHLSLFAPLRPSPANCVIVDEPSRVVSVVNAPYITGAARHADWQI